MLRTGQNQQMNQKQSQQQRLSPQQIQYIKLLQLPTIALEQRIKEEIELNPVLEEAKPEETLENPEELDRKEEWEEKENEELDPVDENEEMDWDEYMENTDYNSDDYQGLTVVIREMKSGAIYPIPTMSLYWRSWSSKLAC